MCDRNAGVAWGKKGRSALIRAVIWNFCWGFQSMWGILAKQGETGQIRSRCAWHARIKCGFPHNWLDVFGWISILDKAKKKEMIQYGSKILGKTLLYGMQAACMISTVIPAACIYRVINKSVILAFSCILFPSYIILFESGLIIMRHDSVSCLSEWRGRLR